MQSRFSLGSLLSILLLTAYLAAVYYAATHAQQSPWAVIIGHGPLLLALLLLVRKAFGLAAAAMATLLICALFYRFHGALQTHVAMTYYLQYTGMMICGALFFGLSLIPPRVALCTRFAHYAHDAMSPELERYTRRVTVAWTLFFVIMGLVSSALFFSPLPFAVWSAFNTLLTLPLVGLMFAVEYAIRRRLLPHESGHGITGAYRAYLAYRADPARHAETLKQ
jgi:uncharacterized membrane protein